MVFALLCSNPTLSDLDFYSQFRGLIWGSLDHLQWKEWYYRCPRPLGLFLNHSMALFSRSLAPESMPWEIQTGTVGTWVKPTANGTVRDTTSDMLVIFLSHRLQQSSGPNDNEGNKYFDKSAVFIFDVFFSSSHPPFIFVWTKHRRRFLFLWMKKKSSR